MKNDTVDVTANFHLCTSCGICKNTCPTSSISWKKEAGMFIPDIDWETCVSCGICYNVCPGLKFDYSNLTYFDEDNIVGNVIAAYNAWSKNETMRHVSASGGVISSLVQVLLTEKEYDVAFIVDQYNYDSQVCSKPINIVDIERGIENTSIPKSRYIPISHENVVSYIQQFPNKKVIFIGTSCAVRGFENVIRQFNFNRENYLIIGLFCDKIFNYNIIEYFASMSVCNDRKIEELHFKNKDSGGWPGNMKFMFSNGDSCFVDANERMKMKEYFMPERCMYCIDKLNVEADISVGDNFTKNYSSLKGSNSVIIRTARGLRAWDKGQYKIESRSIPITEIAESQNVKGRWANYTYSILKQTQMIQKGIDIELNKGINRKNIIPLDKEEWMVALKKIYAGKTYDKKMYNLKIQIFRQHLKAKWKQSLFFSIRVLKKIRRIICK